VRITGLILALIGLLAGAICLIPVLQPAHPDRDPTGVHDDQVNRPNMTVPLLICGVAIVVGGAMYAFGGKGYFVSNNPQVRN
jgi:hypothetical protein